MDKAKLVGTHGGYFHLDEILAFVVLRILYENIEVIRTRDPNKLEKCDIVFDIGFGKYDHHQSKFLKAYRNDDKNRPYASAGLIWHDFGVKMLKKLREDLDEIDIKKAFQLIDLEFVEPVDIIDNGIGRKPNYPTFSGFISSFNSTWEEPYEYSDTTYFLKAADIVELGLMRKVADVCARISAEKVVLSAYNNSFDKRIIILDRGVPWLESIFRNKLEDILYTIQPQINEEWIVQCVPKFKNMSKELDNLRKPFPIEWANKKGRELDIITGLDNTVFCHYKRYIVGAKSLNSAIKLAELSMNQKTD